MTTHTIFKSPTIEFGIKDKDYKYVYAKKNIKKDSILLIEHIYFEKGDINNFYSNKLKMLVANSKTLFNNFCPRTIDWNLECTLNLNKYKEYTDLLTEKVQKNCFQFNKEGITLGNDISKFNHSVKPNAFVGMEGIFVYEDIMFCYITVIARENIKINDEICIWYGNGYFGENKDSTLINYKIPDKTHQIVSRIAEHYLRGEKCYKVVTNHFGIFYGIYGLMDESTTFVMTPRFIKYYEKKYKSKPTHQKNVLWVSEHATNIMKYCKSGYSINFV